MGLSELVFVLGAGCGLTAVLLVVLDNRWLLVSVLAMQYLLAAMVIAENVPVSAAVAKGAAGLAAAGTLAISVYLHPGKRGRSGEARLPTGRGFRVAASLLTLAIGAGLGYPSWAIVPGLGEAGRLGSALLFTLGMLQVGISEEPLRVGTGLLTLLAGFDIAYSQLEPSLALTAILAAVNLGTATVVSYVMSVGGDVNGDGPA